MPLPDKSEIELQNWQHAEPNKCGSCKYFKRSGAVGGDICHLKSVYGLAASVNDNDTCSFYEALTDEHGRPVVFVKKFYWSAGESIKD